MDSHDQTQGPERQGSGASGAGDAEAGGELVDGAGARLVEASTVGPPDSVTVAAWSAWTPGSDLVAYMIEGFVAHLLYSQDPNARWVGGNGRGADIYAEFREGVDGSDRKSHAEASLRVDVKRAFVETVLHGRRKQEMVGFMGSGRDVEAREAATHYALVTVNEKHAKTAGRLEVTPPQIHLNVDYWINRVWLVPRAAVNDLFAPKENQQGNPSGLNRYAPPCDLVPYMHYDAQQPTSVHGTGPHTR